MAGKKRIITAEQIEAVKDRRRAWARARHAKHKAKRNASRRSARASNPEGARRKDRAKYAANPHQKKKNDVHYKYGPEAYQAFLAVHNCEACGDPVAGRSKHIDHDHKRPKSFRGILCGACNVALGYLKEDEKRISGLLAYLKTKGVKL